MSVELRHLRAFVAVAEELNFTRAAERLFIAQQGLSAQIRQLEDRIGARLFDRDTRSVALTPAGAALYQQARALLEDADAAVAAARAASTEKSTSLTVGFIVSVEHDYFAQVISEFSMRHPNVEVMIRFGDTTDPSGGLRARDVDVAFVYGPFDESGLDRRTLFTEPLGVVMAADHALASTEPLTLDAVLAEPTFDFLTHDTVWRDYWMGAAHRNGVPPKIVAKFHSIDGLVEALKARLGVHTGTQALAELGGPRLIWRPMPDLEPLTHSVAWRSGDNRTVVGNFIRTATEIFAAQQT